MQLVPDIERKIHSIVNTVAQEKQQNGGSGNGESLRPSYAAVTAVVNTEQLLELFEARTIDENGTRVYCFPEQPEVLFC